MIDISTGFHWEMKAVLSLDTSGNLEIGVLDALVPP